MYHIPHRPATEIKKKNATIKLERTVTDPTFGHP